MDPETIKINDIEYVRADSIKEVKEVGEQVIIRTYSAGVHVGVLEHAWVDGNKTIILKNARRIHRWRGAKTLNEIAMNGVNRNEYTRISEEVPEITLLPIEVIPVAKNVDLSGVWNDV